MYFDKIKTHLKRKHDETIIEEETTWRILFSVRNNYFTKNFCICYVDGDFTESGLKQERPADKCYWMAFEQNNYPQQGELVTIADMSWYMTENEVIEAIKRFCKYWRR